MMLRSYRALSFGRSKNRGRNGGRVLQRRCDCGNRAESSGECSQCAESHGLLQRESQAGGRVEAPSIVQEVLRGMGQPLEAEARSFMETRFGYDFSHVRVHAGEQAARSAQATNADAYTVGHDIVFASGRYAPMTPSGRRLLAHELTHVVQQDSSVPASAGAIKIAKADEHEASAEQAAIEVGERGESVAVSDSIGLGLQREEAASASPRPSAATPGASARSPCLEEVVGEDIPSLLEAGAVTIIEFGAEWCGPCQQNKQGLEAICRNFQAQPPPVPVRFYSIDIEAAGNEEVSRPYTPGSLPHLYFYVGSTEKAHYNQGIEPDGLERIVADQVVYASTSGAWRGAKAGMRWGALAGGVAGIGGAIGLGVGTNLEGNALMGGIIGSVVGGAALGLGLGAAIGAIAGALTDDRNRGPRQQRRRRLQTKSRGRDNGDALEREADFWADRINEGGSEPLEAATRGLMEDRFGRDFSGVRIHRDAKAHQLAGAMNAFAVTNQANIYFASDGYAPATPFGRAILGHELAHVAQNESAGPKAPVPSLESEAERAATAVVEGRHAAVHHGSNQPLLAITRGEKTLAGAGIGAGSLGTVGAGIGLIAASQMRDQPFGLGAAIGGAIGAGVGGIIGGLIGYFSRRTSSESTPEAEALIQRRYGRYLRGGATGPLHNASVHVVTAARLCERRQCRSPGAPCDLIGWTDTGVPLRPSAGPGNQPAPIPSQAAERACPNGEPLEHATPEHPVIYYTRDDSTAGTLIHEGLHAHSHPDFGYLHNHIAEGTTEYFTRRLQDEINMPYLRGYDDEVVSVERLVGLVGEERLAQAYFTGNVPELHRAVNSQLGRCALITWAFMLELHSESRAAEVFAGRNQDYCQTPWMVQLGYSPAALTPGESPPPQPQPGAAQPPRTERQ